MTVLLTLLFHTAHADLPPPRVPEAVEAQAAPSAIDGLMAAFDDALEDAAPVNSPTVESLSPVSTAWYAYGDSVHDGDAYPRFSIRKMIFADEAGAQAAVAALHAKADPNTGLTYTWDYVVSQGDTVFWLSAPCTYGEPRFSALVGRITETSGAKMLCRCGLGCSILPE